MPTYNGVGAWWMPQWLRAWLTAWFLRDFSEDSAEDHDLAYWLAVVPRIDADRAFLAALLTQADTLRKRLKAIAIYTMVRLFGGPSFGHQDKESTTWA